MGVCPCCASPMLRHVSRTGVYWLCGSCRQELPGTLEFAPGTSPPTRLLSTIVSEPLKRIASVATGAAPTTTAAMAALEQS